MAGLKVAVVGAGGAVGREMLALLADDPITPNDPLPLAYASPRSRGTGIPFGDRTVRCGVLWEESFEDVDVALFAAGGDVSREWAPRFVEAGAVVIDNSSAFRLDPQVPLVVPEINADAIPTGPGIIANPNCSTIILLLAIHPLRALGDFKATVSTYQAVSGAGKAGLEALHRERAGEPFRPGAPFPFPIEGNLFPLIGEIDGEFGGTQEEVKVIRESRKILDWPDLALHVTCVRVPVERCHSEAVTLEFDGDVDLDRARRLLAEAPGVQLFDDPKQPPLPRDRSGTLGVAIGRLRRPVPHVLQLWVVGDQLLKGAAQNAVDIARLWARR
ncbi:MAG: aspartate-semialdehyde dehydrogenase [Planctomycetes bacterium]|nr:aspartate-semialdehyde dehydrogenase [Planctomycetota bacterium]